MALRLLKNADFSKSQPKFYTKESLKTIQKLSSIFKHKTSKTIVKIFIIVVLLENLIKTSAKSSENVNKTTEVSLTFILL